MRPSWRGGPVSVEVGSGLFQLFPAVGRRQPPIVTIVQPSTSLEGQHAGVQMHGRRADQRNALWVLPSACLRERQDCCLRCKLSCIAALQSLLEQCAPSALHMQRMLRQRAPAMILFNGDVPHEPCVAIPLKGLGLWVTPMLSWPASTLADWLRARPASRGEPQPSPVPALTGACLE